MNTGKYSMDLTCFSWVQIIKKSDLPSTAKLIAMYLSTFMNLEHNIAWPSITRISNETGLGRSTVFKWLNHLESEGWLIRRSKSHEVMTLGGSQMQNEYIINIPAKVVHEITLLPKGGLQDEQRGSTKSSKVVHQTDTNNNINNKENNNTKSKNKFSDEDLKVAREIFRLIKTINPDNKEPNFNVWANDVRLMREIDGHTHNQITGLYRWVNSDNFWRSNVLSPSKLREKWDALVIKKNSTVAKSMSAVDKVKASIENRKKGNLIDIN